MHLEDWRYEIATTHSDKIKFKIMELRTASTQFFLDTRFLT